MARVRPHERRLPDGRVINVKGHRRSNPGPRKADSEEVSDGGWNGLLVAAVVVLFILAALETLATSH